MAAPLFDASKPTFAELLEACPVVPGAIVSKPLLDLPGGKVILFAMDEGQAMSEHQAPFVATVHVLEGRLRFGVAGQEQVMGAHAVLAMPESAPHDLTALEPTRFLLTLFKQP
ncbi:MAG: cupin domain-containing protein [Planctomycetota bacterium]|jgi:quercetin dioxygenase-like cupin family protein